MGSPLAVGTSRGDYPTLEQVCCTICLEGVVTKRRRLTVILGVAGGLVALVVAIQVLGAQQVDREAHRVDGLAKTVHLDERQRALSAEGPNAFATALKLPPTDVAQVVVADGRWCASIELRRLGARRHRFFSVRPDGSLQAESACPVR